MITEKMLNFLDKIIILTDKKIKELWRAFSSRGFILSVIIHIGVLVIITLFTFSNEPKPRKLRIVQLNNNFQNQTISPKIKEVKKIGIPSELSLDKKDTTVRDKVKEKETGLIDAKSDTSFLTQEYDENSLNISIFFPSDWQFIDNKNQDKLDAIIFFPKPESKYNQQISVTIQVDRGNILFNSTYYDSSFQVNQEEFYFGQVQKVMEQVSQVIYIKSRMVSESFFIQAIAPSEADFNNFQKLYFEMAKSFKVGR